MKKRSVTNLCKNALGTVLLLMGAFFVCSTLLSMRMVFADPIAPSGTEMAQMANSSRSGRASPRGNTSTKRSPPAPFSLE